jgi:hypothetical protein
VGQGQLGFATLVDESSKSAVLRAVRSLLVTWIWFGVLTVPLVTGYALSANEKPLTARRQEVVAR